MKHAQLIALAFIGIMLLVSCRTTKTQTQMPEVVPMTERTNTEVRTITLYDTDTLYVEIPAQSSQITTRDTASHLETDFAYSDARINADGSLFHALFNKQQTMKPTYEKPTIRTDSIIRETIDKPVPVYVPREVERKLTAWEKFRLNVFPVLIGLLAVAIVWIFRKPLMQLARRLI